MSSCIFGPVASRRLGLSLGVDLVPLKYCSYDCLYCQVGRTTHLTTERKEYVPLATVIKELKAKLDTAPDYITLSGSGEPTLYAPLEQLISRIKELTDIPLAVLTNGSLLWQVDIQQALTPADLVAPSLDAGCEATFEKINRPNPDINFNKMLQGLIDFRQKFSGQYWLEVFIIKDVNTSPEEISRLADCIKRISPDRVQVNSATRPTAESSVVAPSPQQLENIAAQLAVNAEVIADFSQVHKPKDFTTRQQDIINLLKRRPCSVEDIADGLGLPRPEALKYIAELTENGKIAPQTQNEKLYYKLLGLPSE